MNHIDTLKEMLADLPEGLEVSERKRDAIEAGIRSMELLEAATCFDVWIAGEGEITKSEVGTRVKARKYEAGDAGDDRITEHDSAIEAFTALQDKQV